MAGMVMVPMAATVADPKPLGLQDLLRVQDAGVEERVVGQRRPDGLPGLADLLGLADETLGQVVGDVKGEVAADDGDARGGGHALF